ncbi:uncharacterized protein LOC141854513 [Brevipalpus obovatus]|uniref:uncharacterized protein LOC141854513 n=1 Tax=Brevipalpus obovatus TaxID=246614 RepID=UPI003D9E301D
MNSKRREQLRGSKRKIEELGEDLQPDNRKELKLNSDTNSKSVTASPSSTTSSDRVKSNDIPQDCLDSTSNAPQSRDSPANATQRPINHISTSTSHHLSTSSLSTKQGDQSIEFRSEQSGRSSVPPSASLSSPASSSLLQSTGPPSYCQLRGYLSNHQQNLNYFYHKQRHLTFNISMCKLNRYRQSSDPSLRRSVLICNTLKRLERELAKEGIRINFGPTGVTFISTATASTSTGLIGNSPPVPNNQNGQAMVSSSSSPLYPVTSSTSNSSDGLQNESNNESKLPSEPSRGDESDEEGDCDGSSGDISSSSSLDCSEFIDCGVESDSKYLLDLDSSGGRITPYIHAESDVESSEMSKQLTGSSFDNVHGSSPHISQSNQPLLTNFSSPANSPSIPSSTLNLSSSPLPSVSSLSPSSSLESSPSSSSPPHSLSINTSASSAFWSMDESYGSDRLSNLNWSSVLNFDIITPLSDSAQSLDNEQLSLKKISDSSVAADGDSSIASDSRESNSSATFDLESKGTCSDSGLDSSPSKWDSDESSSLHILMPPVNGPQSSTNVSHHLLQHLNHSYHHQTSSGLASSSSHVTLSSVSPSSSSHHSGPNNNDEIFDDIDMSLYDFDPIPPLSPPNVKLAPVSAEDLMKGANESNAVDAPSSSSPPNSIPTHDLPIPSSTTSSSSMSSSPPSSPPSSPSSSSSSSSDNSASSYPSSSSSLSPTSSAASHSTTCGTANSFQNNYFRAKDKLFMEDMPTTVTS